MDFRPKSPLAVTLSVLAAMLASAQSAPAQTSSSMATLVCRPAASDETATAKMVGSGQTLICRPLEMTLKMSDGSVRTIGEAKPTNASGPDLKNALTPKAINDAWVEYLTKTFNITHSS